MASRLQTLLLNIVRHIFEAPVVNRTTRFSTVFYHGQSLIKVLDTMPFTCPTFKMQSIEYSLRAYVMRSGWASWQYGHAISIGNQMELHYGICVS